MISDEIWQEHITNDKEQDHKIHSLHLAVFGCPEKPETVRMAIVPTMMRLNTWLDVIKVMCQTAVGLAVFVGAVVGVAKAAGVL